MEGMMPADWSLGLNLQPLYSQLSQQWESVALSSYGNLYVWCVQA
jgi:hypothetical protein